MSVINTATSTSTVGAVASPNRQELEKAVAVQHARVEALDERLKQEISTVAGLCQQVRQTQGTPTTNVQDPPDAGIVASSFAVLPPEINSGRMFLGAGSAPMLQASAAWDGLAAELASTSKSLEAVSDQRKEAFESLAKATRDLSEK